MPQQPDKPGIRAAHAIGLTVFLVTGLFLSALLVSRLGSAFASVPAAAAAFSTLCAAAAAFVMLLDAADLWVRGRKMTAGTVKVLRVLVFAAVLGALAASFLGNNSLVIPILAPAMIVYLFVVRRPAGGRARAGTRGGIAGARAVGSSGGSTVKSRQKRGGKKRR